MLQRLNDLEYDCYLRIERVRAEAGVIVAGVEGDPIMTRRQASGELAHPAVHVGMGAHDLLPGLVIFDRAPPGSKIDRNSRRRPARSRVQHMRRKTHLRTLLFARALIASFAPLLTRWRSLRCSLTGPPPDTAA